MEEKSEGYREGYSEALYWTKDKLIDAMEEISDKNAQKVLSDLFAEISQKLKEK